MLSQKTKTTQRIAPTTKKEVSMTTIANYVRNIKVFFNYLYEVEREIPKNPVESVENPKVQRKVKKILTAEEIKKGGYIDYAVFDRYCRVEIFFVTRLKSNTHLEPLEEMDVPAGSLVSADCLVRIGSQQQKKKMKHALRMVQTEDSQGNLLFLVTNRFDLTCDEISEMYRSRWAIETFFKWMKQHLQIKHLYRTSEQAVTNQIWIALIACCLLVLVKLDTDRKMPLASCRSIYHSGLNCFVN
nr:IS4 family transposase [Paenibacillus algorifonticola]